jgi:neurofibromin 1
MTLVKSSYAINSLIAKFAGRIVYHISASNWAVVFHRLRNKIHFLASTSEDNPDTVDLQLMTNSALDRIRLVQVLNGKFIPVLDVYNLTRFLVELSSLLVSMKPENQVAVAVPLRIAVWNWINVFPAEFNDVVLSRGRLEGAPERVFDLLYNMLAANEKVSGQHMQQGNERLLWPTLTILNCITSERLTTDFQMNHFGYASVGGQKNSSRKVRPSFEGFTRDQLTPWQDVRFIEDLMKHANSLSKLSGVALICALDMCRAAMHIRPTGEVPLRLVANDIAHEFKVVPSNGL